MKAALKRAIPQPIQALAQRTRSRLLHEYHTRRLFGRDAPLVPPRSRMFDGTAEYQDFKANGEEFLRYYVELGHLQPDATMLDVGSGIGRKTVPLIHYLNHRGRYEGIEIVKAGVEWCQQQITRRHPSFHFQQIDVFNAYYNPAGIIKAAEYRFPFSDALFDFVTLGSVFTHLQPADLIQYLSEVARVLKPGGRCLITFFLLNQESSALIQAGRSSLDLRHGAGSYRVLDPAAPERAIGYDQDFIAGLFEQYGLAIEQPIRYGSWCGRARYLSYQDIVVALKPLGVASEEPDAATS
jgi:SAM-dependent methyltransferase